MTYDQGYAVLTGLALLGTLLIVWRSALGEGVALWWPTPGAGGEVTCAPCIQSGAWAAADLRPDDDRALVQRGEHARRRAEDRCAVHAGRLAPR